MDTLRKIGAVVVMVLAVLGVLLTLGGCIGAWVYKDDVTLAATTSLTAISKVTALGERATGQSALALNQVSSQLTSVQDGLAERAENRQQAIDALKAAVNDRYGPTVQTAVTTVQATTDAIVAFNQSLEAVNRIPGVNVRTLTPQLEAVDAKLQETAQRFDAMRQTVQDKLPDGTPIQDAVSQTAASASAAATSLQDYSTRLGTASQQSAAAADSAPKTISRIVWLISFLMILLAAGQVSLFIHALDWFRRPPAKTAA